MNQEAARNSAQQAQKYASITAVLVTEAAAQESLPNMRLQIFADADEQIARYQEIMRSRGYAIPAPISPPNMEVKPESISSAQEEVRQEKVKQEEVKHEEVKEEEAWMGAGA